MNGKGLDFKHKEVINIKDGRRLRICARCYSRLRKWGNNIYNGYKKEDRYSRFEFERVRSKKDYVTKKNQILIIALAYINKIYNPKKENIITKNDYYIQDNGTNLNEIVNNTIRNNDNDKKISIDDSKLNIFYFYVGQADCTLIMNNNETMLIDAGDDTDGELIVQFLKDIKMDKIDYLIATHPDNDHIGGMADIIRSFEIVNLYIPNRVGNNKAYENLTNALKSKNESAILQSVNVGILEIFGDANWTIKWVDNTEEYSDNNSSIVVQLNYKEQKYLFTGDIETQVESKILKDLEQIDVLKVAHHASNSSTSNSFLEKVKPKIAIISSGSGNKGSKWPNEKCLKRLLKFIQKENIYITERDGTIWLISDGTQSIINKMNNINLDGAKSKIEPNLLTIEYLESINLSMLSFLIYK